MIVNVSTDKARAGGECLLAKAEHPWLTEAESWVSCGLTLSGNDRRVIVISQYLVSVCAGRSVGELGDILSSKLTDLDVGAMRLLDRATERKMSKSVNEKQLALLEQAGATWRLARGAGKRATYRRRRRARANA